MEQWAGNPWRRLSLLLIVLLGAFVIGNAIGTVTGARAFLDPVADKLMVAAALIVLVDLQRAGIAASLIIIGREIAISALREWMAKIGAARSVAVSLLGRVKTSCQMVAIPMLLYHDPIPLFDPQRVGTWLIYLAALLTLWSMAYYLRMAWPHIADRV